MNDQSLPVPLHQQEFLVPFDQLQQMASAIAKSGLFGMKTPDQALALMLIAQAERQHPATITQDYDIIQGRAARKTNSVLARFQAAGGSVEWHALTDKLADATFTPPARAGKPLRLQWTIEMAKTAKLVGKDNWTGYARAMLRARLIAEGVRAVYPAALGGMLVAEEAQDLPPAEKDVTAQGSHITEAAKPELPLYDQEAFDKNLPKWRGHIAGGKKTPDEMIATITSKYTLTEAQKQALHDCAPKAEPPTADEIDAMWTKASEATLAEADVIKAAGINQGDAWTREHLDHALAFIADPVGGGK